jgi:hypothetical protein
VGRFIFISRAVIEGELHGHLVQCGQEPALFKSEGHGKFLPLFRQIHRAGGMQRQQECYRFEDRPNKPEIVIPMTKAMPTDFSGWVRIQRAV